MVVKKMLSLEGKKEKKAVYTREVFVPIFYHAIFAVQYSCCHYTLVLQINQSILTVLLALKPCLLFNHDIFIEIVYSLGKVGDFIFILFF